MGNSGRYTTRLSAYISILHYSSLVSNLTGKKLAAACSNRQNVRLLKQRNKIHLDSGAVQLLILASSETKVTKVICKEDVTVRQYRDSASLV